MTKLTKHTAAQEVKDTYERVAEEMARSVRPKPKLNKAANKRFDIRFMGTDFSKPQIDFVKNLMADELAIENIKGYKAGLKQKEFDLEIELSRQKKEIIEELEKMKWKHTIGKKFMTHNDALDQAIKTINEIK